MKIGHRLKIPVSFCLAVIGVPLILLGSYGNPAFADAADVEAKETNITKPNVVWILLDGCRAQNLGCYGYERPTSPAMDAIAQTGTVFLEHYTNASKTYNSVPSYMTGKYFPRPCFSMRYSQTIFFIPPPPDEAMFGEIMRENGYASAMFTNMPLFQETDRLSKSFDEVFIWRQGDPVLLQRWAVMRDQLEAWLESKKDTPFFLYIHAADTHFPHEIVPPYDQWIDPEYDANVLAPMGYGQNYMRRDKQPFREEDKAYLLSLYDGMILDANEQIRVLKEKLDQLGILDNTVILITADHGQLLGENGYTVAHVGTSDQVMHVPLIMSGPGIPSETRVDTLTENVDIVPTLVALLSLETSATFDGRSLVPAMRGTKCHEARTYTFAAPDRITYEIPANFVLRGFKEKFEFDSEGQLEYVFEVPDLEPNRTNSIEAKREAGVTLENHLHEHYFPLLRRMQSLPVTAVKLEAAWLANAIQPREHVVDNYITGTGSTAALETDHKWAYTDGFLWTRNGAETAPEIKFQVPMPDGVYDALVHLYNSQDRDGMPASSLVVQIAGEPMLRRVLCVSLPREHSGITPVPLGKVKVDNGHLAFTLHPGQPGYWTLIHSIELYPENRGKEEDKGPLDVPGIPPEKASEYHELMRGLGYL